MTLRRQKFLAFLLVAVVVGLLLLPFLPTHGPAARHHLRGNVAAAIMLVGVSAVAVTYSFSAAPPEARVALRDGLFKMHCARLC